MTADEILHMEPCLLCGITYDPARYDRCPVCDLHDLLRVWMERARKNGDKT